MLALSFHVEKSIVYRCEGVRDALQGEKRPVYPSLKSSL